MFHIFLCIAKSQHVPYIVLLFAKSQHVPHILLTSVLNLSLSLIASISSVRSFQRREAVGRNVLLWPEVFEDGIATTVVWRNVIALVALRTAGGGGNMLLSSVGAPPWYIQWNKVSAPTCLLCTSGWVAFLL